MGKRYFSDKIVKWYLDNKRPLPWRDTTDAYRIWLSEVILQQTRVAQGLPYYERFINTYPTVASLAAASEQEVLRQWQGLGYYTRARNLHKCAKAVVTMHDGSFPKTSKELHALPGIGQYTSAAIASFAFGEPAAVVDGNVFRILSRIFGIDTPVNSPEGKKTFTRLAQELLSTNAPALHNQAVMEFGATFCTPKNPNCSECPFATTCLALKSDLISTLPVKIAPRKSKKRYFYYVVVEKKQALLMRKREGKDIWHGLFDFLLIEKSKPVKPERIIADKEHQQWFRQAKCVKISKRYKHVLTHQTIHCRFLHVDASRGFRGQGKGMAFYTRTEIARLPKPALISRFLEEQDSC